jgi:hypothetical protein
VIVTGETAATLDVVAVNVPLVAPATSVTLPGTAATPVLLLDSATSAPPDGAELDKVSVPVEVAPPVTLVGLTLTACKLAGGGTGVTVRVAVRDTPP